MIPTTIRKIMTAIIASLLSSTVYAQTIANSVPALPTPVTAVNNRADLIGAQTVDWGQLGSAGTQVPQPFQASTNGGFSFTVLKNNSTTPYLRADQGNGFSGDFLASEKLLYSKSQTAFDFRFPRPIQGFGSQIQIDRLGEWVPYVQVFTIDGADYSFQFPLDFNNQASNGTAPFVGIMAGSPVITRVLFDSFSGGNTAINRVSVVVPEPAAIWLIASILCPVYGVWRRVARVGAYSRSTQHEGR